MLLLKSPPNRMTSCGTKATRCRYPRKSSSEAGVSPTCNALVGFVKTKQEEATVLFRAAGADERHLVSGIDAEVQPFNTCTSGRWG